MWKRAPRVLGWVAGDAAAVVCVACAPGATAAAVCGHVAAGDVSPIRGDVPFRLSVDVVCDVCGRVVVAAHPR